MTGKQTELQEMMSEQDMIEYKLISLKDIILRKDYQDQNNKKVESYIMKSNLLETKELGEDCESDQVFIVKRAELTFNDKEC